MANRAQLLRENNQRLSQWLERMSGTSSPRCPASPEDISGLLSELLRAGAELRSESFPARGSDAEVDGELDSYRRQVERIRDLLPSIHGQLLAERARLEWQRARVKSSNDWAQASRQTF